MVLMLHRAFSISIQIRSSFVDATKILIGILFWLIAKTKITLWVSDESQSTYKKNLYVNIGTYPINVHS
jgi:hypothetical protein